MFWLHVITADGGNSLTDTDHMMLTVSVDHSLHKRLSIDASDLFFLIYLSIVNLMSIVPKKQTVKTYLGPFSQPISFFPSLANNLKHLLGVKK